MQPIVIDNSILSAVAACDTQAALRYALGLTMDEDRAPLMAGTLAHALLAAHLKGQPLESWFGLNELLAYETFARDAVDLNDRLSFENVMTIMRQWVATHPVASLPFRVDPALVEVGFAVPLDDNIVFVGRMDALVQDESGAWYVLEHKTTGRLDERWRRRYRTSAQITGYTWAAQQHLQAPVAGCFVNGIEFGRLPTDTKKCRTHGVPYPECSVLHARFDLLIEHRAPHQTAEWLQTARQLARRYADLVLRVSDLKSIADVRMRGQFNGACELCQFAPFCAVGRPVSVGETLMRFDPWSPYEHAFKEA